MQPTVLDVINAELQRAFLLHPGRLMASSVTAALAEAGYAVISDEQMQAEIALAHQAGYEEGRDSVGSPR